MSATQRSIRARVSISVLATALVIMLMVALGAAFPSWAHAAVGEFQPLAPSPVDLTSQAVDPTTNLIYAQENGDTSFFVYDPRTNEWTELPEAPIDSGNNGGAAYLNGKIYTVYTNNSAEMGVYDIATKEWSVIENPLEEGTGDITAVGGSLYLVNQQKFVKYDPVTKTTTPLAEVPEFKTDCEGGFERWGGLQPYQGKIYGHQGNGCTGFAVYDIESNTWTELPEVPEVEVEGELQEEGAVLGSAIDPVTGTYYTYGGYGGKYFYRFDIATNTWSTIEIPFSEVDDGGMSYVSLPGLTGIYIIQGEAGTEFTRYTTPEPAPPPAPPTPPTPPAPPPLNPARWLVPTGQLPIKGGWISAPLLNLNPGLTLSGTAKLVTYGTGAGTELAKNTVYLSPGATKTLYLHLNSAATSKARGHRLKVQLLLALHDELGRNVNASGVYVLIAPSAKHKKKHNKK